VVVVDIPEILPTNAVFTRAPLPVVLVIVPQDRAGVGVGVGVTLATIKVTDRTALVGYELHQKLFQVTLVWLYQGGVLALLPFKVFLTAPVEVDVTFKIRWFEFNTIPPPPCHPPIALAPKVSKFVETLEKTRPPKLYV
jgi:hypothetical protein